MCDVENYSWLLAAVMQALCHPSVKLSRILPGITSLETSNSIQMPIMGHSGKRLSVPSKTGPDDNTGSVAQRRDSGQFPLLISYMCQR